MNYFITEAQRKASGSTCYFEFQKGKFKRKFWKDDSICMDDTMFESLNFPALFSVVMPNFDYFGITLVTPIQYEALKIASLNYGDDTIAAISELDTWAAECFLHEKHFSILGI